jgi:hypothetical protein
MDEWRRRHADWDPVPFARVARISGTALASALADAPDASRVIDAYLRLVAEALRLRYIDGARSAPDGTDAPPLSLLGRVLLDAVPRRLTAYPAERRLAILADVWNLGEGLLRQPSWMGRIASALIRDLDNLEHLDETLAATLAPLITPTRQSSFSGPFTVQVIDLREIDDELLPGRMHAATATVLCVHDRVSDGLCGAVVLGEGGASRSVGTTPCLADAEGSERPAAVDVRVVEGQATVAGHAVPLPTVRAAHGHVLFPSGFVVVSAVDSQRLWIVESVS